MYPTDLRHINLRIPADQHAALAAVAAERDVTVQHLIRGGIALVTGVPDSMNRRPYGDRKRVT